AECRSTRAAVPGDEHPLITVTTDKGDKKTTQLGGHVNYREGIARMLRPMAREPLCLFLVTSASWRLRGVKRPQQRSNGEQPQRPPVIAGRGSLAVFLAVPSGVYSPKPPPEHSSHASSGRHRQFLAQASRCCAAGRHYQFA